jgi:hypothetical protein
MWNHTNGIDSVRLDPQVNFTGFLSLTILEINLVLHYQRNMLMCTQWYVHTMLLFRHFSNIRAAAVSLYMPARLSRSAEIATRKSNFN